MARITVLGGSGYAGGAIVAEAAKRGHEVTSVSRTAVAAPSRAWSMPWGRRSTRPSLTR
jgi:uncharacterized protein YbjT (DUF2867 family)